MAKKKSLPNATSPGAPGLHPSVANAASSNTPAYFFNAQISRQSEGPIPSPEILKEYDHLMPGLADRIVAMAEEEAKHRRAVEVQLLAAQIKDASRYRFVEIAGQVCGLAIGLAAIGCATYAGVHGAQITGTFIGTTGVTGLVTAFIMGRTLMMKQKQQDADIARENSRLQQQLNQAKLAADLSKAGP